MPLFFADGRPFVTGLQANVFYAPTPAEPKARLVLRVVLEGLTTQAMVDTGGLYLFCMPSVARALHLDAAQALGAQTILFRNERVRGTLLGSPVGDSLTVSAGVACYPTHALGAAELVAQAGKALDEARRRGADRVETAPEG